MTNNVLSSSFSEETKLLEDKMDKLSSDETRYWVFSMSDETFYGFNLGFSFRSLI